MNRLKGYIKKWQTLGLLLLPLFGIARPDTATVIPTPTISANNPVCENATLKLETPFQDGMIFHWYDLEGQEISVVATAILPDIQLSMAGQYRLIAEQDGCFSEPAIINISVTPRPDTPMVSNNGPLCEGETLELDGPNALNTGYKWIDPFGTVISNEPDPTISNIPKELAGDYFLEITQNGCASPLGGTSVGVIAINEVPELTVSGPACEGDSLWIRGPNVPGANYNWEGPNGFQSAASDSLFFAVVNPTLTGKYTLVLEASGCESPIGEVDVAVFAKPKAILTGGGKICLGDSINLNLRLSGTAPFEVIYKINEVEARPITTNREDFRITRSPTEEEFYALVSMQDKNGCPATLKGEVLINVFEKPEISLINDTLCDEVRENYQVQIKLEKGQTPFSFQGLEGNLENSMFISQPIPTNQTYGFQIVDGNNCLSKQITGQYECSCLSAVGSVDLTPIDICGSETASILSLNEGQLDANDQLFYVVHDSPNSNLGNVIFSSSEPRINYSENLNFNQTYYVSPVIGNTLTTSIDFEDRCLAVGAGTPLTFLPIPETPTIAGIQNICPGVTLELNTTPVSGQVTYTWMTPIEMIETSTPNLIIDPVESDYTGDYSVSINKDGCTSLPSEPFPVIVAVPSGMASAGKDTISCGNPTFQLDAAIPEFGTGVWTSNSGSHIIEPINPKTEIRTLQEGQNVFYWTLSTEDCPNFEVDSVSIAYRPNATALNDFFVLEKEEALLEFNVLENDVTPAGHEIWVEQFSETHEGTVNQIQDGDFTYRRPFNDFKGNVVFEYLLCFETPTCPTQCDTAGVSIDVMLDPLDPGVYIPDGITPNNDGVNDRLIIEGLQNHENNELLIFDRWGNLVFEASPYKNTWEGNYNNEGLPEGAYYYVLKTDVTNKRTLKGRIYIIR